jgi:hypothetical protein
MWAQVRILPSALFFVRLPPWLSWQSARLLTDRSLVRSQAEALFVHRCHIESVVSSVARIPAFQAGGPGSIPGRRTIFFLIRGQKGSTHGGTRTHNPALRRGVPYPLGHAGLVG